jgi:TRAP-type C4-dicarboxylate transport system permease small subunit
VDRSWIARAIWSLARLVAVAGGAVLLVVAVITVVSIVGRAFIWAGLTSIRGDFELVEAGVGFAVFSFLPWAHLTRGHAVVTILTGAFSARVNAIITVISDLLMLVVAAFLTWRHFDGMLDKLAYGETTLLLRFPLWWSYAVGLPGAVTFVLVAMLMLAGSLANAASPTPRRPSEGLVH